MILKYALLQISLLANVLQKDYINNTQPEVENLISKYYEMFTDSSKYTGHLPDATIGNFLMLFVANLVMLMLFLEI